MYFCILLAVLSPHHCHRIMGVIARQSIKGAIANYIGIAIGFFTTFFVLTDCLSQEEIGLTRVMVDIAMLFSSLAQLGSNASIIRFFPYFRTRSDDSHHGIFAWALLLPFVGMLLITFVFIIFRQPIQAVYAQRAPLLAHYFHLLVPLTFFALYQTVFETCSSVLLRITVPKLVREVGVRLFNLAAYLLYGHGVISLDVFIWLFCGSYGLAMVLNFCYLLSLGHLSFHIDRTFLDRAKVNEILRYTFFMTMTALAANIPLFNTLFLGAQKGLALTGVYTIALYIANVVEVPYRSLGAISRPMVASAVKDSDWAEVSRLSRQVSVHQFLVSIFLLLFIWINLDVLYAFIPRGDDYAGGMLVVLIMGMAKVLNSSLAVTTDILSYSRHFSLLLPFMLLLTLAALLGNSFFIPRWGINGSAAATLTAYLVYYGCMLPFISSRLGVRIFSRNHLKVIMILVVLVLMHLFWTLLPSPQSLLWTLALAVAQTSLLLAVALTLLYRAHISADVNRLIDRFLLRPLHLKKTL
ncbi:MAG: hypothetical protein AUK63_1223 [bacterium P3]|nr:MAG: hypothetical protein AUK63_1223 [bacterium P3]KWW40499.1 MAG: hypothetical protein F083_1568 [bacterium F083]